MLSSYIIAQMIYFLSRFFKTLFLLLLLSSLVIKPNLSEANFIRDTEIERIVYSWAEPIFDVAGISKNTIKINIIANNQINAFVTDGKNMFLNTGLIIKAGSASGLIGVIAHETGHIAAGHILKLKEKSRELEKNQLITNLVGLGLYILANKNSTQIRKDSNKIATSILSIGPDIARKSFFSYSRANEYVADSLGVRYLKKIKRNPAAMGIILEQLYGQELLLAKRQDPFLRTHPLTRDRINYIKRNSTGNEILESKEDLNNYLRIKAKLEGFLESPGKVLLNNKGNTLHERYARTIAYFKSPIYSKAIAEINMLIKDYPDDPYFYELKGQILSENGFIKEAIDSYKKSLKVLPNAPLIMLPYVNLMLETYPTNTVLIDMKKVLDKAVLLEPNNVLAWRLKGIAHARLGETVLADLAAAEENLLKFNNSRAKYFSTRVIKKAKKNSPESIRGYDILRIVKNN
tara:strand:+ start:45 stop:1430 length:1386 start_codon:yes stop_codon:yes gene_type:complete